MGYVDDTTLDCYMSCSFLLHAAAFAYHLNHPFCLAASCYILQAFVRSTACLLSEAKPVIRRRFAKFVVLHWSASPLAVLL